MTKTRKLLLSAVLLIILPSLLFAVDFGLIVDQSAGFGGIVGNDTQTDYTALFIPRFSTLIGDNGSFLISAGLAAVYEYEEFRFVPELLRTEFHWIFRTSDLRIGRMHYSDPLGFIAEGLFDGAQFTVDTAAGSFSAGAWYTGFLYKKRANIAMNEAEVQSLGTMLDYDNFVDTYFAPRRALVALDWVHPGLADGVLRTRLSVLCQFDLTDEDVNSQYITAQLSFPVRAFTLSFGGSLGLLQDSGDQRVSYALEFGTTWALPTIFPSRLSLLGRYASGRSDDGTTIMEFRPVTLRSQSPVLQPKIPGLSMILLDYSARFNREFGMSLSSFYFIRNDLHTYVGYPVGADDDGHFLGNEFFARLFWRPASDVYFNLGGGLFLPSLGNAAPRLDNAWRVELGLTISLF